MVDQIIQRFLANELSYPGGIIGRLILAPLWNRRNAQLNDQALEAMKITSGDRVLDVGFGGGYLISRIAALQPDVLLFGVDVSPAMVSFVEQREKRRVREGRLTLQCASVECLPFKDASFSRICSINSLFYWQDAHKAFSEIARVAELGARLVLCYTDRNSLKDKGFAQHGLRLYGCEEIQKLLSQVGFRVDVSQLHSDQHRQFWCIQATRVKNGDAVGGD